MFFRTRMMGTLAAAIIMTTTMAAWVAPVAGEALPPPQPEYMPPPPANETPASVVAIVATIISKSKTFSGSDNSGRGLGPEVDRNVGLIETDAEVDNTFRFTGLTRVVTARGEELPMAALRLPCTARLHYFPARMGVPYLQKIEVLSVSGRASANWTPKVTDRR